MRNLAVRRLSRLARECLCFGFGMAAPLDGYHGWLSGAVITGLLFRAPDHSEC